MEGETPTFSSGAEEFVTPRRRHYRSASRDEQKRATRSRILECALQHFSERGFEAASLRDIAAGSEVTHGVIRLHFGGKEELWRAAIDMMFERQRMELDLRKWHNHDQLTTSDLQILIHDYVRYCARHTEHVRIMMHESLRESDRVRWLVEQHVRPTQGPIYALLKRAMEEGILANAPLPSLIYIWTAASQTIFALAAEARHLFNIDVNEPASIDAHAEAICAILIRPGASGSRMRTGQIRLERA
ncbi:TetR/AcrR family transcriptional regulator [Sphingomonas sp. GM_Shp_2]|uniref:TetR/AcrR family transcriptional regulator n=1 Tax=Sphingomonas sp. GM_Shp_2 TaxID=2937380 RepID=UPI00226A155F|nr:TetR/AcrR family transcriptional regulator [Sphingomonas sp. GM_Shp_2]